MAIHFRACAQATIALALLMVAVENATAATPMTCAGHFLRSDGTVWSWGGNFYGDVGDDTVTPRRVPVRTLLPNGITAIGCPSSFSAYAVRSDGTLWSWGDSGRGTLGDPAATAQRGMPAQVPGIAGVSKVAGGNVHGLALKQDGTLWSWGSNFNGQLGDGTQQTRLSPGAIANFSGVTAIAANQLSSGAVRSDGTVWLWGTYPQLDGMPRINTLGGATSPTQVPGVIDAVDVAVNSFATLILTSGGLVRSWGLNLTGDGVGTFRTDMFTLPLTNVKAIAMDSERAAALKSDGTVWAWGRAPVGNGTNTDQLAPVRVTGLTNIIAISARTALKSDGTLWEWASNIGNETLMYRWNAASVPIVGKPKAIFARPTGPFELAFATMTDGSLVGWGTSWDSELPTVDPLYRQSLRPVVVPGISNVTQLSLGYGHILAVKSDGTMWSWGSNSDGQLGLGSNGAVIPTPTQSALNNVVSVAAALQSFALKADGTVWGWGYNPDGYVGDGTTVSRNAPVKLALSNVISLCAGEAFGIAVKNDGTVWGWGFNGNGQLGLGDTGKRITPTQVSGAPPSAACSTGKAHTVVLAKDGSVWTWGRNELGELGYTSTFNQPSPRKVPGISNAVGVYAGGWHTLALTSDGSVWGWGSNRASQLGTHDAAEFVAPTRISGFPAPASAAGAVAAGSLNSFLMSADGTVYALGRECGTMGQGSNECQPLTPVQTLFLDSALASASDDSDGDGIPNAVEVAEGLNGLLRDNNIFASVRLFAMQQYRDFLGREGDAAGVTFWTSQLSTNAQTRAQMIEAYFKSAEFQGTASPVVRLYFAYFRRIPDYAGLTYWIGQYRNGVALQTISAAFAGSGEFNSTYGALSNAQFVNLVYTNVLGRPADAAGLAYWRGQLDSGALNRGQVMAQFSESPEYAALSASSVYVTMMYAGMLRRPPDTSGFAFWVDYLDKGNSGLALISGFLTAPEYRSRFLP